jgi:hypothetical protein
MFRSSAIKFDLDFSCGGFSSDPCQECVPSFPERRFAPPLACRFVGENVESSLVADQALINRMHSLMQTQNLV